MLFNVLKTSAFVAALSTLVLAAPTANSVELVERDQYSDNFDTAPHCENEEFKNQALKSLNAHRRIHGSPNLKWDPTLAAFAQKVANTCKMEHSGGPYGENLFGMGPAPANMYLNQTDQAVFAWVQEIWWYDWSNPGSGALHATAALWKSTKKVGCAWTGPCPDGGASFVCEFNDAVPNMGGQYADNVFPLGTKLDDDDDNN